MSESVGCQTHFVGWDRPLLISAAEFIANHYDAPVPQTTEPTSRQRPTWDLSKLLVVLPTGRAVRRLSQRIRLEAERRGVAYRPPRWITVGELPERLYRRASDSPPLADETERVLAWTAALRATSDAKLVPLVSTPMPRDTMTAWIELATTLNRIHEDLASANLSFTDVAAVLKGDPATEGELARWESLRSIHAGYLARLKAAHRSDPSEDRRQALANGRCELTSPLLLVGTLDLSEAVTAMLRQVTVTAEQRRQPSPITALVAAEPALCDHFDEFGSVNATRWLNWKLPLDDAQLVAGDDLVDQATAALEAITDWQGTCAPGEITIGVTDESMVAPVEFELRQAGLEGHRELGWTFALTPIGRLVELLRLHLTQRTWQSLAALVRQADVHAWLDRTLPPEFGESRWLVALDELLAEHFPTDLSAPLTDAMLRVRHGAIGAPAAKATAEAVSGALRDFEDREPKRLSQWAALLAQFFDTLYAGVPEQQDRVGKRADEAIQVGRRVLERLQTLGETLDSPLPAATAMDLISGRLFSQRVGDPPRDEAIQISGWLDLALDESPALVVIGFNHPFVPDSVTADPFLPGGLRSRLRMSDNERRLARDIYATQLILATRQRSRFIVGRRGADGSPTPPTRLLAAAEPADVARRLVRLLEPQASNLRRSASAVIASVWGHPVSKTRLPVPILDRSYAVRSMSVTSFASYLACPYRFYLRHVLQLKPLDDAARELAANQFGDLIHQSLEWFGDSPAKDETRVGPIEDAMIAALDRFAAQHLGSAPTAAVRLQIEQARRRLRLVAKAQAERRRQGWRIWKVEASVGEQNNAGIDVDGRRMTIRGRFDRIDLHDTGQWSILDYKTHGHHPRKKHLQKDPRGGYRWVELQLPIYRLMIPYLVGQDVDPDAVTLGYFNIADKDSETRINPADFTSDEFHQAEQVIRDCIRRIWAGDFEPSVDPVLYDDYAMILQSDTASPWLDADDSSGDNAALIADT